MVSRMAYWVHIDKPTWSAKVHEATCSHCNHGRGTQDVAERKHCAWYGEYEKYADAWERAVASGYEAANCKHCEPHG
jgi:hypothetical protein